MRDHVVTSTAPQGEGADSTLGTRFGIRPSSYLYIVTLVALSLTFVGFVAEALFIAEPNNIVAYNFRRYLSHDAEGTLHAWFSTLQLAFAAGLFAVIGTSFSSTGRRLNMWHLAAAIFLMLSIDESLSLHERMVEPTKTLLSIESERFYAWLIPGLTGTALGIAVMYRWWASLAPDVKRSIGIGVVTFIVAATGVEFIGNLLYEPGEPYSLAYVWVTSVEELAEIIGVALVVAGLLNYRELSPSEDQATVSPIEIREQG